MRRSRAGNNDVNESQNRKSPRDDMSEFSEGRRSEGRSRGG